MGWACLQLSLLSNVVPVQSTLCPHLSRAVSVYNLVLNLWCFLRARHVGDLGNVKAEADGVAKVFIEDSMIKLSGEHSIIGRTMVVSVPWEGVHTTLL